MRTCVYPLSFEGWNNKRRNDNEDLSGDLNDINCTAGIEFNWIEGTAAAMGYREGETDYDDCECVGNIRDFLCCVRMMIFFELEEVGRKTKIFEI